MGSDPIPSPAADTAATPAGGDDYALMEAIARGDKAALAKLYDRYSGLVLAIARRMLGDRDSADELLMDVFFELWRKAPRYDASRGSPQTYVVTLTRSRAIDRRRRTAAAGRADAGVSKSVVHMDAAGEPDRLATRDLAPDPAQAPILAERAAAVRKALSALDPDHRSVIESAFYDGLTHTEIAEQTRRPLGTVKGWIRQGMLKLRDALRREYDL